MTPNTVIFTPSKDLVCAGFTYDLAQLIRRDEQCIYASAQGTYLPNLRSAAARQALKAGMEWLLFIDSDMRFPADAAQRLRSANHMIVGANCKQRQVDEWTARKDGRFVSSTGQRGIMRVDTLGMGMTLIHTKVFATMPEPWFDMPWDPASGKHVGEDVSFCRHANDAGFVVWVDHDLSQEVRHAGLVEHGASLS